MEKMNGLLASHLVVEFVVDFFRWFIPRLVAIWSKKKQSTQKTQETPTWQRTGPMLRDCCTCRLRDCCCYYCCYCAATTSTKYLQLVVQPRLLQQEYLHPRHTIVPKFTSTGETREECWGVKASASFKQSIKRLRGRVLRCGYGVRVDDIYQASLPIAPVVSSGNPRMLLHSVGPGVRIPPLRFWIYLQRSKRYQIPGIWYINSIIGWAGVASVLRVPRKKDSIDHT